jgi:CDP-paratose 2-epimerase
MRYKKILVTGGAGFVGVNIVTNWLKLHPDTELIVIDNLKRRGSELNLSRLKKLGAAFFHADVRQMSDLEGLNKIDLLIECCAEPSVLAGYGTSPRYVIDTNFAGLINCLELARFNRADVVFLSTSRVYPYERINSLGYEEGRERFILKSGQSTPGVSRKGISEDFPLEGVRSFYGSSKLCGEFFLSEYIKAYGLKGVINRCGVLAGPWQMGKVDQGFISLWLAAHIYGKGLKYIGFGGKGKQVRDVLHVDDLSDLLEIQLKDIDRYSGMIFNAGGGIENSISLKELTTDCRRLTGNDIKIGSLKETREADIKYYVSDNSKISSMSSWKPKRSLNKILTDTRDWILENRQVLKPVLAD